MSTRTNCICNSPDTGYIGPCPAHPERMITSKATLCPDCGDEHGDKPAATGSGEPRCVRCNQPEYDPIHRTANYGHEYVPTPPASQPTVTLDKETRDKMVAELTEANYWSSPRARDHIRTALNLLRAAETQR